MGRATQLHIGRMSAVSPALPVETNFYRTGINPAGKLQCCPDALGSRDNDEVVGTDGGRERMMADSVTDPDPPPSGVPWGALCLERNRGL